MAEDKRPHLYVTNARGSLRMLDESVVRMYTCTQCGDNVGEAELPQVVNDPCPARNPNG